MAAISCILLVDDDDTTNFLNQALLQRLAAADHVLVAQNGQQALDLLRTPCGPAAPVPCPALILLDMKMPVMNGLQFLEAYTQGLAAQNPAVVIMLTTSLHASDVDQMQRLPIAGYLTKPLTTEKIQQLLQQHFGYCAT